MTEPKLTEAEWRLMGSLWERGEATAREVLADVEADTGWAYTTVKTMLDRLAGKGLVREAGQRGNAALYRPRVERDEARNAAARDLVDRAFGGAVSPLVHSLVETEALSADEREELIRLLRQAGDGTEDER